MPGTWPSSGPPICSGLILISNIHQPVLSVYAAEQTQAASTLLKSVFKPFVLSVLLIGEFFLRSKDIEASGFNGTAVFKEVRVQSIVVEFILTHVPQLFPQQGNTQV